MENEDPVDVIFQTLHEIMGQQEILLCAVAGLCATQSPTAQRSVADYLRLAIEERLGLHDDQPSATATRAAMTEAANRLLAALSGRDGLA